MNPPKGERSCGIAHLAEPVGRLGDHFARAADRTGQDSRNGNVRFGHIRRRTLSQPGAGRTAGPGFPPDRAALLCALLVPTETERLPMKIKIGRAHV